MLWLLFGQLLEPLGYFVFQHLITLITEHFTFVTQRDRLVGLGPGPGLPDPDVLPPLHVELRLTDELQVQDLQLDRFLGSVGVEF